jgi:Uma2 family endonuclease
MAVVQTLITAEQLLAMGSDARFELVRGELVEMSPVGRTHSWVVAQLLSWMFPFARRNKLGVVGTELGFILSRDPDVVLAPDLYFVSKPRWGDLDAHGFFEGAPDLAVEVLSPDDRATKVHEKIRKYFRAGSSLFWLVDPDNMTVTVYRPSGEVRILSGSQAVTGEEVLPGFSFTPEDLFQL